MALPVVKKALDDPDLSTRTQALKTLIAIWRLAEKPELKNMLIATKTLWRLKPTSGGEYSLIGNKDWYEKFFSLLKAEKVSFHDLDLLGGVEDFPEDIIGNNLNFLINIITSHNPKNSFFHKDFTLTSKRTFNGKIQKNVGVIKKLFSQIKQPKNIQKLYPLLTTLLHDRYWGGKTTSSGSLRKPPKPRNHIRFNDLECNQLLKTITSTLQAKDIEKWQSNIPSVFLTDLFLEALFAQKAGIHLNPYDKDIPLRITVINRSNNEILATSEYVFDNYEETRIILTSKSKNYPNKIITINIHLDRDKWMFLASISIDFKPHGVMFDSYIPLTGINEMSFTTADTEPGEKLSTVWIFEHIYQPN